MLQIDGLDVAYGRADGRPTTGDRNRTVSSAGQVLFGVSLEVPAGGLVCVLGRNGVGKTTLLDAVMGVLTPAAGQVRLSGRDITRAKTHERVRAGMGYVPQGHVCFPHLTVKENLTIPLEAGGRADHTATDEALDLFPALLPLLTRRAGVLSGGQRQQLAIARALVSRPRLLLLDEPTEGIQPSVVAEIETAIDQLHQAGMSILLVEQHIELAARLADSFVILEDGAVAHTGGRGGLEGDRVQALLAV